jgi:transcriptional regulator with XRE-family HTH domain
MQQINKSPVGREEKADRAILVRTIGERLRAARKDLHNMSLETAARRLGYANSTKLSKIENASDTLSVPVLTILKAARLYQVPTDYIFGLTDDWDWRPGESTEAAGVNHVVMEMMENGLRRQMAILQQLEGRLSSYHTACEAISAASAELNIAYQRLIDINPGFEDETRGSASLKFRIDAVSGAAKLADSAVRRFRTECSLAKNPDSAQAEMEV